MTYLNAVKAYVSVRDLNRQKLSSGVLAKKIFDLFNALKPIFEFYTQEEQKIYSNHPSYDTAINGIKITGNEEERAKALAEVKAIDEEFKKLNELESEIEFEKFDLNLSQERITISGEDIGNLSEFINFI